MIEAPQSEQPSLLLLGAPRKLAREHFSYRGPIRQRHLVLAGARGTGKSVAGLALLFELLKTYPGFRAVVLRKTRVSQTSSVLKVFEDILKLDAPYGSDMLKGGDRTHRSLYKSSINGAEVLFSGLDEVENLKSTDWDLILFEEGTQATKHDWHIMLGSLRNWCCPELRELLCIFLVNPDIPTHWILGEIKAGRLEMLSSYLWDNPKWHTSAGRVNLEETDEAIYARELELAMGDGGGWTPEGRQHIRSMKNRLTGAQLERDLYNRWVAAEGACFPEYSDATHEIDAEVKQQGGRHWIEVVGWAQPVEIDWYFIAMDFGFTNTHPGVLHVWAVDPRGRIFLIAQLKRTGWLNSQWAEKVAHYYKLYPFECGVGDSEDPEHIETINRRMEHVRDHNGETFMVRADKRGGKAHLIDQMREYITFRNGGPKLYILKNSMVEGPDPTLLELGRPVNLQGEIPGYRYALLKDDETLLDEKPVKDKDDDIDACQYGCRFVEGKQLSLPRPFKPKSFSGKIDRMIWEWLQEQRERDEEYDKVHLQ